MRLLLAEDEASLSKALTAILERNHYSVDAVYDGVEALAYLEAGNYDTLILEIMMPKLPALFAYCDAKVDDSLQQRNFTENLQSSKMEYTINLTGGINDGKSYSDKQSIGFVPATSKAGGAGAKRE